MAKVTLIKRSSPICPGCIVMQTQLEGEGIPHEVIDITTTPEAIEDYGLTGVPVILVDNDGELSRFDGMAPVDKIKEAMGE
jgi:glutaredoxin